MLSIAAAGVWGKSTRDPSGTTVTHWLPLHQHLDDTQLVAQRLVDQWLPAQTLDRIARDLPGGRPGVRHLAGWLAACHDVGKASPAFAVQVPVLCDHMISTGLTVGPAVAVDPNRRRVRHDLVGHLAVRDWLDSAHDFPRGASAGHLASVIGSHHGVPPNRSQLTAASAQPSLLGTGRWDEVRRELLTRATQRCGGAAALDAHREATLTLPSLVLLTGIVIMADWIASSDLFPLDAVSGSEPTTIPDEEQLARGSNRRLDRAWSELRLPAPWRARDLVDVDEVFAQRFSVPGGRARPVQRAAVEAASSQGAPGMLIIEAPMGEGKTEAALLAAECLAHRSGAGGCFIALPTQATSDAMFARALHWVEALPTDEGSTSVFLAHGKAALNEEFAGLHPGGHFSSVGVDAEPGHHGQEAVAHWWFSGRKRGVLASFVVGTIDQVLFAGLKSRHLMLRHLALAGKVVIIDEVHAYDVYMSQYLDRVLHWLGRYGVPVVLLSATLPPARRAELLLAYEDAPALADAGDSYPVITGSHGAGCREVAATRPSSVVELIHLDDELATVVELLRERLSDGGCAVVVRNTVGRVQETADAVAAEFGEDSVTVNHSRFLSCDRATIDRDLLRRFGPPGPDVARPARHVVVASQVVEQSLDVDFDLMITDLAPVDLVLQRIGRLHRHERPRPPGVRAPVCAIVGVQDWAGEPVVAQRGSNAVYGEHTLLRAAALLGPTSRRSISLPDDIAPLVHRAYGQEPVCPPAWSESEAVAAEARAAESRKRISDADSFRLDVVRAGRSMISWVDAGVGDADDSRKGQAQVRDGDDTLEVVVVIEDSDGGLLVPGWIERHADEQIPLHGPIPPDLAHTLAACTLRLPPALSHEGVVDAVITALEARRVDSFDVTPTLKGQLVLALGRDRSTVLGSGPVAFRLTYDRRRGLLHERL